MINVLITTPSLNIRENVSGISNMTKVLIKNNNNINYFVFQSGKKDNEKRGFYWITYQPIVLIRLLIKLLVNDIDIFHSNIPLEKYAIIREYTLISIANLFRIPTIAHLRGGTYNLDKRMPTFLKYVFNKTLRKASKVIVLGKNEYTFYHNEYNLKNNKISILPNSVEIPIQESVKGKSIDKKLYILYLGRIDKNKGLIEIVQSLKHLENIDYELKIAGDGPDRNWFLELCEENILGKYTYLGILGHVDKIKLYKKCHIFLLPSYFEGLPNALLESMSYGLIPIVTNVGSIPNLVVNEINGITVPIKNFENIKKAIELVYKNKLYYNKISNAAHNTIKNDYSIGSYILNINKIYKNVIKA